ncbi:unnamed protein product [Bursaphelenchus xylophilus]|uniref:(pine wood nematode) hypothetical protein n=1 Tax=Bursaphelenchus xylophilus TaxID=6326 RepID=A0A1I7SIS2_BURXY|nr:unnamed protein product [Bursaphelenchus xylophilus]CAG9090192.1 unnamed protein product [Bursaphelenchus xylophilus]
MKLIGLYADLEIVVSTKDNPVQCHVKAPSLLGNYNLLWYNAAVNLMDKVIRVQESFLFRLNDIEFKEAPARLSGIAKANGFDLIRVFFKPKPSDPRCRMLRLFLMAKCDDSFKLWCSLKADGIEAIDDKDWPKNSNGTDKFERPTLSKVRLEVEVVKMEKGPINSQEIVLICINNTLLQKAKATRVNLLVSPHYGQQERRNKIAKVERWTPIDVDTASIQKFNSTTFPQDLTPDQIEGVEHAFSQELGIVMESMNTIENFCLGSDMMRQKPAGGFHRIVQLALFEKKDPAFGNNPSGRDEPSGPTEALREADERQSGLRILQRHVLLPPNGSTG